MPVEQIHLQEYIFPATTSLTIRTKQLLPASELASGCLVCLTSTLFKSISCGSWILPKVLVHISFECFIALLKLPSWDNIASISGTLFSEIHSSNRHSVKTFPSKDNISSAATASFRVFVNNFSPQPPILSLFVFSKTV